MVAAPDPDGSSSPSGGGYRRRREIGAALRNAAKLGSSLIVTWGLGLVARLMIPRSLGPEAFGVLNFADVFASTGFVLLGLGLDTYVRKEIPLRPRHAEDFVGGLLAVRGVLVVVLMLGMELVLRATHRSDTARHLVYLFSVAYFFGMGSGMSAALLHAVGRVNEMSVLSVVTKVLWAAGILASAFSRLGAWAFAASLVVSEGVKSLGLFLLARKHLGFRMRVDFGATLAVLRAALPYFVSGIASSITNKIDVTILALTSNDREVGWYGVASGIAGLTMFLTPLISWVLVPLFARAAAASEEELSGTIRRSSEFILTLCIPVSLALVVGADFVTELVFGKAFAPSAGALRLLAVAYLLMYVSIISWCALTVLKYDWGVTAIMSVGLLVNPPCNLLLIGPGMRLLGGGGGGVACALSTLITELVIVTLLLRLLGRRGFDARLLKSVGKSLGAAVIVVVLDIGVLRPLGPLRLVVEGLLYLALVLLTRAVDVRGTIDFLRAALRRRRGDA